jgi:uncharacterized protein YecT (DUF1311 family)
MLSYLSDAQTAALMGVMALIGGAIGFFVKRWLSESSAHERTALLSSLADLRAKMKSEGLDFAQIAEMERAVRGTVNISPESAEALTGQAELNRDDLPAGYWTTVAMRSRAHARFAVVDAELEEALIELMTLVSNEEASELGRSHVPWKVYRKRQMSYAGARYPGGTFGPLYGTLRGIEVTERRVAELKSEIEARKNDPT